MKVLHPNWCFVTHEALSLNPHKEFKKIFSYLNLDFNHKVQKYIEQTTNRENSSERDNNQIHLLYRNSRENIFSWKNRLSEKEILRVQKGTKLIAKKFYDEIH